MAFKPPRIGGGERERRPANYGPDNVGGNGRRNKLKLKVSLPKKTNVEGISKKDRKTAESIGAANVGFKIHRQQLDDDLPDPGGHPDIHRSGTPSVRPVESHTNSIASLRDRARALAHGPPPLAGELVDSSADDYLDKLLSKTPAQERPKKSTAELREHLAVMRQKLSILRTQRSLDDEPTSEPQGSNKPLERGQDGAQRHGDDGQGRASASGGGSQQLSNSESVNGQLATEPPRSNETDIASEATGGTAGTNTDVRAGEGEIECSSEGAQPVHRNEGAERDTESEEQSVLADDSESINGGSSNERGSEEEEASAETDGAEQHELINALEIDPSLYENAGKQKQRRRLHRRAGITQPWIPENTNPQGEETKNGQSIEPLSNGPGASGNNEISRCGMARDERLQAGIEESQTRGPLDGQAQTEMPDLHVSAVAGSVYVQAGGRDPEAKGGSAGEDQKKHLPVSRELPRGITSYNERQELDIARLFDASNVVCNNCAAAEHCPEFQENAVCAYDDTFTGLSSRDIDNVLPTMEVIADLQKKRAMRGVFLESKTTGGIIDPNVSRQLELAAAATERVARIKAGASISNTKSVTVVGGGNSGGGGLLSKLIAAVAPQEGTELPLNAAVEIKETTTVTPPLLPEKNPHGFSSDFPGYVRDHMDAVATVSVDNREIRPMAAEQVIEHNPNAPTPWTRTPEKE